MSSAESAHGLVSFKVITWYSMTVNNEHSSRCSFFQSGVLKFSKHKLIKSRYELTKVRVDQ